MKFLDILIIITLFVFLGFGIYVLLLNFPGGAVQFQEFKFNKEVLGDVDLGIKGIQFYPNMRYKDRTISYSISDSCDLRRRADVETAFSLIADKSILDFYEIKDAEIKILCSNIAPRPEEEGHFVAGEGGPSEIINTTNYAVIFSGKVSLFRENECENPNIAIHEILHALGFDHNNNSESVMYPITKCEQKIDDYLILEINRIYGVESRPDLAVESAIANKTGRYLNFEISIINLGLDDSDSSNLEVYAEGELVKEFDLESIDIGTRKILTVQNLAVLRGADLISFKINTLETELSKENNFVELKLIRVED